MKAAKRLETCKYILRCTVFGGLVAKSCPTLASPWTAACQAPLSEIFPNGDFGIWR